MRDFKTYINLIEAADHKLRQEPLPYKKTELDPAISEQTIDYHYGKLAKAYVDRYNSGEGDAEFNKGGAILHNIYFGQLKPVGGANRPFGAAEELIDRKYKSYDAFKEEFLKIAMTIQGSGWIFLDRQGEIKTIKNHNITGDPTRIALLVDWWEHAWALDYQAAKDKYLNNFWRIVDWSVVNDRLQGV
jgi:Fe-Mn family superoxide dismutase